MNTFQSQLEFLVAEQSALDDKKATLRKEAIAQIEVYVRMFDLKAEEINFNVKPAHSEAATKKTRPPKYRDPTTGKTWTGCGRKPAWAQVAYDAGKLEEYLI